MRTTVDKERSRILRESLGASNWLVGCSIAAAIFLVILVVAGFAIYGVAKKGFGEQKIRVVEVFDRNYTKWNDEKKIPDAQAAVFSDLHEVSQREDASFWVVMLCFGTANTVLEDGKVTDDEAKSMKDVADFVKEKPGAGLVEFGNFFQSHPDIEKAFKSMQQRHAPAPTQ